MLNFIDTRQDDTGTFEPVKFSELTPNEFLLGIAKRLKTENESERAKVNAQTIIQMCRRHRNMTPGDAFGYWKNGVWCESPSFSSLHAIPMFQQLVVGAESNFAQADIRLSITANTNAARPVERIARDIYEILDEKQWNEVARQAAFYAAILKLNAYYVSRFNAKTGDSLPMPKYDDLAYEQGGMAICTECYTPTDFASNTDQVCPQCGNTSLSIIDDPQTAIESIIAGFDMSPAGEPEMAVYDGLDVSADPNGDPADVKSCKWIELRQMAQKEELKRLYPHLKLEGKPEWSYQTRLKKALKRYENGEAGIVSESDKTEFELRQIWLDLTEYEGYIAPQDLKIGNKVCLKRGERMGDKYPKGVVIGIVNREIAFVDAENKNRRVKSSLWISDGISFEGLGAKAGLGIQRKINQLENIAMEGETRSLKGSLLYDPEAFDGHQLEGANTNIPKKPDFATGGQPLSHFAVPLKVEGLSAETMMYMASQKQTMQEIMGVPDVMLGQNTATDKTFGGQALRSRNALGLLTPKTLSTAFAKEGWLLDQLDIIQTYMSPDALRQFGARTGKEWLEDEIQAFFECDFERDLTVEYVPGTEVPESRFDKGMRLRADIGAGFIPMTPALAAKLAQESNFDDIDVDDYESNQKLAEKRYNAAKQVSEQADAMYQQYEMMMVDPSTGMRAADETGRPVPNPVLTQIMGMDELQVYRDAENHSQMIDFWAGKIRDLAGSTRQASPLLIAVCDAMIDRHNALAFETSLVERERTGVANVTESAPSAIGQAMLAAGQDGPK